jgi:hypothetical protein
MHPAPIAAFRSAPRTDPRLALLRAWISLGLVAMVLTPATAWTSHSVGWLPYWAVVAPALSLALLRRHFIAAALAAFLARRPRRRGLARRVGAH